MKKLMVLTVLALMGCKGKLVWVSNTEQKVTKVEAIPLNTDIAGVRFTFDDGPDLAKTPKVLDILKKYRLQATFFVEGINLAGESEQAKERRELLKRIHTEGHVIGNHTYDHKDLCRMSNEKANWELGQTAMLIQNVIGPEEGEMGVMRPPYGKKCKQLTKVLYPLHLTPVYWDIDPREWERDPKTHQFKTADQVIDSIMTQYHQLHDERGMKNMVIILHDTKQVTVELLPKLLAKLTQEAIK